MVEEPVCHHCGYVGPVDARYCAQCGRALGSRNVRLKASISHILSNLSPFHIGFLGLVLSVIISVYAARLVVWELSFLLSLIPLALGIGSGYAYLGWHWQAALSSRSRIGRMLLVFVSMGVFLAAVRLIDRGLLSLLSDRTHMVVYQVPGVYRESSPGHRNLSIDSSGLLYWLAAMIYGLLSAAVGNLVHRARQRRPM
jgi:hypothetical protein